MTSVLQRLRERKLFQWPLAYVADAWIVFHGIEVMAEPWELSPGFQRTFHLLVAVGFLVALVLAWYHGEQGRQRMSGIELLIIALLLGVGADPRSLRAPYGGDEQNEEQKAIAVLGDLQAGFTIA
jgi:hypothetical protein